LLKHVVSTAVRHGYGVTKTKEDQKWQKWDLFTLF